MNENIQRLLKELDIKVDLKFYNTIANYVPASKDLVKKDKLSGFIYQDPCGDCNFICIGKTKRSITSRLTEHKRCIKYQRPNQSALCEHSIVWTT